MTERLTDEAVNSGFNRVIIGDCRETLRSLSEETFQCCVTSPPYWGLRDYGTARWEGGAPGCDHLGSARQSSASTLRGNGHGGTKPLSPMLQEMRTPFRSVCEKCGARRIDAQIGMEPTPKAYVDALVDVFSLVRRVLRDDGTLWLNIGDSYAASAGGGQGKNSKFLDREASRLGVREQKQSKVTGGLKPKDMCGIPWRLALALQDDGWWLRSDVIWHKPNPMPESVTDRPTKAHEYVFMLAKSETYFFDGEAIQEKAKHAGRVLDYTSDQKANDADPTRQRTLPRGRKITVGEMRNARTVWTIPSQPYGGAHFATMPPRLAERCILAGSRLGSVVLDPFMGSGTVGLVSEALGRRWLGCELNAEYETLIRQRTAQAGLPWQESDHE